MKIGGYNISNILLVLLAIFVIVIAVLLGVYARQVRTQAIGGGWTSYDDCMAQVGDPAYCAALFPSPPAPTASLRQTIINSIIKQKIKKFITPSPPPPPPSPSSSTPSSSMMPTPPSMP